MTDADYSEAAAENLPQRSEADAVPSFDGCYRHKGGDLECYFCCSKANLYGSTETRRATLVSRLASGACFCGQRHETNQGAL